MNKYKPVNTYKYFQNIYCMCVYLYIHNKYTQNTHIYHANKNFYFGCDLLRLIVWQHNFFNIFFIYNYILLLIYFKYFFYNLFLL